MLAAFLAHVASAAHVAPATAAPPAGAPAFPLDRDAEDRILALRAEQISEQEVKDVLARSPAPRILCFQGSPAFVTMAPFADFLIALGYPAEQLRNPRDGKYTYSSHLDSGRVAGALAWHYEREGMVPMLIGHSRGGLLVIRILYQLAESANKPLPVWNPLTDSAEGRYTVRDPLSGAEHPVLRADRAVRGCHRHR